jgi:hypothetical protein
MKSLIVLAFAFIAGTAAAQAAPKSPLETKTIELKHLRPEEAVSLLKPYVVNGAGSVSWVSASMPIITIKDIPESIARMEKVLAKYDHSPATVRLVFQLIEADTGPRMVAAAGRAAVATDLDMTLRSVLRFSSYRLMAQSMATSGENSTVYQKLANADTVGWPYTYDISAQVGTIRLSDLTLQSQAAGATRTVSSSQMEVDTNATGSVRLTVHLLKRTEVANQPTQSLIETGLDVPLGQTIVLGTTTSARNGVAIILTVKPELVRVRP